MPANIWPHEDTAALNAFYGDPRSHDGREDAAWAAANLVKWTPPYPIFYSDDKRSPLLHMWVHKKCLATFNAAFVEAKLVLGIDYIKAHRLDVCGGTYCYRVQRGGSRLSVHAWGCAIDMDPGHNPFQHKWEPGAGMIDGRFAAILQKHGFGWRGANGDDDPMHFQLCHH